MARKKILYNGTDKTIKRLCEQVNDDSLEKQVSDLSSQSERIANYVNVPVTYSNHIDVTNASYVRTFANHVCFFSVQATCNADIPAYSENLINGLPELPFLDIYAGDSSAIPKTKIYMEGSNVQNRSPLKKGDTLSICGTYIY